MPWMLTIMSSPFSVTSPSRRCPSLVTTTPGFAHKAEAATSATATTSVHRRFISVPLTSNVETRRTGGKFGSSPNQRAVICFSSEDASHSSVAMTGGFSPDSGQRFVTIGARSIITHAIFRHEESVSLDHRRAAMVATRVLPLADLSGEISRVHVLQAGPLPVLDNSQQIL